MKFLLTLLLIQFVISAKAAPNISNRVVTNHDNETVLSCTTADGDAGECREASSCSVEESRRERLVNCGSVLRGTLNHICCPINETFNANISSYSNDANCGRHFEFWDIVGGADVKPHFLPWTVAIYQVVRFPATSATNFTSQQFYRFICGGTLVSNRHVVSAAHCVNQGYRVLHASDFLIKVGAHNIDSSGTFHRVENVWAHENYRSYQRYNDISLFKLSVPVRSEYGLAACLPVSNLGRTLNSGLREGTLLSVAGWGTTRFLGSLSQNLREANVRYIDNSECTKNYSQLQGSSTASKWHRFKYDLCWL